MACRKRDATATTILRAGIGCFVKLVFVARRLGILTESGQAGAHGQQVIERYLAGRAIGYPGPILALNRQISRTFQVFVCHFVSFISFIDVFVYFD